MARQQRRAACAKLLTTLSVKQLIRSVLLAGTAWMSACTLAQHEFVWCGRGLAGRAAERSSCRSGIKLWRPLSCRAAPPPANDAKLPPAEMPWWKAEQEMGRVLGSGMPFRVVRVSPPPSESLGTEMLDAKTGRGDLIQVRRARDPLVVRRVRFQYELVGGKYKIRRKILEVQTPQRAAVNEQLEDMVAMSQGTETAA
eukprot:TRINITY_DN94599_c0_g1_i1.p1 TRINITY_DN94599_c0_g1~~TRINITY_DN94599_c0_g1_i1.p1  ORF type:complete len:223 (+),score=24.22 TRINITY_DN94599_c0_g1_i1:76-669(+)